MVVSSEMGGQNRDLGTDSGYELGAAVIDGPVGLRSKAVRDSFKRSIESVVDPHGSLFYHHHRTPSATQNVQILYKHPFQHPLAQETACGAHQEARRRVFRG
jgi:hypothetical protein